MTLHAVKESLLLQLGIGSILPAIKQHYITVSVLFYEMIRKPAYILSVINIYGFISFYLVADYQYRAIKLMLHTPPESLLCSRRPDPVSTYDHRIIFVKFYQVEYVGVPHFSASCILILQIH